MMNAKELEATSRFKRKTPEQEEYVAEILESKTKKKISAPKPDETKKTDYMRNCIFWIEEFEAGRCDDKRLLEVIKHLQLHLNDIKRKYFQ